MYPITVVPGVYGLREDTKNMKDIKSDTKDLGSRIGTPLTPVEFQ
jgi:hypothetical protein